MPAATSKADATAFIWVLGNVHCFATESCQRAVPVDAAQMAAKFWV